MALSSPAATAAGRPAGPARPARGLLPLLLLGNTAMYALYIGVAGVLLALQVEHVDPAHKEANLGLVTGIAAVFATVFNPLAGALSDRTGRRNPWILGGGLLALPAAFLLGSVHTVLLITIGWCLVQAVMNVYQAALTSVVPDRIPLESRGRASAAVGLGLPLGSIGGALVAAAFTDRYRTGYLLFGALVAVTAVVFTACTREERLPARPSTPVSAQVRAFAGALKVADFRWAFIGRALLVLGYFLVNTYLVYILQDHIDLPAGMEPAEAVAVVTPVTSVAMMLSTVLGGYLSDRLDRRKLFVGASALLSALGLLVPALSPTWPAVLVFAGVVGLGFGCFMAVDTALVTLVLPSAEDAARDMGVLNIANAGPQIMAPFAASVVVTVTGGYTTLFVAAAVLSVAGALSVRPIRSVR
ncbi:MFS transporter [Streptomyces sp. NPDC028635]|uniref:MFS transporter n=1 Tax=Streptomyces sp. NPDC028635 TaxID=3154800 RepID=UPI0033D06DBA